jgi:predicted HicB family RNase H-like nuclease
VAVAQRKNQRTLELIFSRPVNGSLPWRDIEALFQGLGGEVSERAGSRVAVVLFGEVRVFHKVDGYHAKIEYDEETDQFRGEILGLSGGADFYGSSPDELRREFQKSLEVFLEVCKEQGIEPRRSFSGKFNLRISPELHEKLAMTAEVQGKSLNTLAQEALQRSVTS